MSYKVSVIIPTYNVEFFIRPTIKSVINQTIGFENIELILVDNNSTDSTKNILKEYSENYPNIKCFFQKKNSGTPSKGRNIGIKNATADYIMFLDADDRYVEDFCEVLYNVILKTKQDFVICNYTKIHNNNFNSIKLEQDISYKIFSTEEDIVFNNIEIWNRIYDKKFLQKHHIHYPNGYFVEDVYFHVQCLLNSNETVYLDNYHGYIYNIRDSGENASSSNTININWFMKSYKTYFGICDFFKELKRQDLLNKLMKKEFINVMGWFVRLNENKKVKKFLLNEIHDLIIYSDFDDNLDEIWANFIFKNIKQKNFIRVLIFSKIINILFNFYFLRKLYRKIR